MSLKIPIRKTKTRSYKGKDYFVHRATFPEELPFTQGSFTIVHENDHTILELSQDTPPQKPLEPTQPEPVPLTPKEEMLHEDAMVEDNMSSHIPTPAELKAWGANKWEIPRYQTAFAKGTLDLRTTQKFLRKRKLKGRLLWIGMIIVMVLVCWVLGA